jgi:hypothetical protein
MEPDPDRVLNHHVLTCEPLVYGGMKPCKIETCDGFVTPKSARGMCVRHYRSFMTHGDPHAGVILTPIERFWSRVDRRGADDCWPWQARCDKDGYGWFWDSDVSKVSIRAHRYSWMLHTGAMPDASVHVCHHCDNPPCVNPAHLFVGTNKDNIDDKMRKGRHRGNETGSIGNFRRRLTDDQVAEIRAADLSQYATLKALGRVYGISGEHARRIRNGTRR